MQAALLTINEDKFRFSSVHCCYISPVTSTALLYHVMREKDGKTFCYRSVRATQEGSDKTAFNAFVTFQLKGGDSVDAFSHCSHPMPEVPDPGQCVPYLELKDSIFTRGLFKEKFPIDVRFCSAQPWEHTSARQQYKELPSLEPRYTCCYQITHAALFCRCSFWVKSSTNLDPDDDNVHYLALAYSSDFCTPSIVTRKHPNVDIEVAASLSHSIMFHKPTNFNSWNLLDVECDSSIGLKCSNMAR